MGRAVGHYGPVRLAWSQFVRAPNVSRLALRSFLGVVHRLFISCPTPLTSKTTSIPYYTNVYGSNTIATDQLPLNAKAVKHPPGKPRASSKKTYGTTISTYRLQKRIALASSTKCARLSAIFTLYPPPFAAAGLDVEFGFEEGTWPKHPTPPADLTNGEMNTWMNRMLPQLQKAR